MQGVVQVVNASGSGELKMTMYVTLDEMTVNSVTGVIQPNIEAETTKIELNDLPDFLKDEDTRLDITNPVILLKADNPMETDVEIDAVLTPKKNNVNIEGHEVKIGTGYGQNKVALIPGTNIIALSRTGECSIEGVTENIKVEDINNLLETIPDDIDVNLLRKRVGMVFQKPNPFPMSIYDNVAYGPRTHGIRSKAKLDDLVEKSLRDAAIWNECKDRLKTSALGMSGGQQQRLCIARALAVQPEVLLMDEPTSALDPISTSKIEDLVMELKKDYTIVMVTHNMQQAVRVSDNTAFFLLGEVIEYNETEKLFSIPADKRTEDYITGRFG